MTSPTEEVPWTTRIYRRIVCGTAGGIMLSLVGHPFDTVKVHMQVSNQSLTEVLRELYSRHGIRTFFRGIIVPMATSGFFNAYLFTLQMLTREKWEENGAGRYLNDAMIEGLAGASASPAYVFLLAPIEVTKLRMQLSKEGSVLQMWRTLARTEGVTALWNGYTPMLLSRVLGLPPYFTTYHTVRNYLHPNKSEALPTHVALLGGGLGGMSFWLVNYPTDVIKTRMQTQSNHLTLPEVAKVIHREHGWKGFYKGFGVCLARAFPANAGVFFGFET
eukprot:PhF_6_TR27347/c0_g1_i1/m.40188/K15109/SLC25A20_29, CACT, CACL, CRC1; solute carrier family 25 (mitochondrial carnitine/acylcarnitine transporter), member 20/29